MTQRVLKNGRDRLVFMRTGDVGTYTYRPIAGQTNLNLDPRLESYLESKGKNQGGWALRLPNEKDWSASVDIDLTDELDVNANEVDFEELQDMQINGTLGYFVFVSIDPLANMDAVPEIDETRRMLGGSAYVNCPLTSPANDKETSTVTFTPNGGIEILANLPA